MVRTQIQLTDRQAATIKRIAAKRNISMAEVIRESVDRYVDEEFDTERKERRQRALRIAGQFSSGLGDLAQHHDKYFSET